jgi:hypothetical protein
MLAHKIQLVLGEDVPEGKEKNQLPCTGNNSAAVTSASKHVASHPPSTLQPLPTPATESSQAADGNRAVGQHGKPSHEHLKRTKKKKQ